MKRFVIGLAIFALVYSAYSFLAGEAGPKITEAGGEGQASLPSAGSEEAALPEGEQSLDEGAPAAEDVPPDFSLSTVHAAQARLQNLPEGPASRQLRQELGTAAEHARRRGMALLTENPVEAWRSLSLAYFATADSRERANVKPTLDRLVGDLILSRRLVPELAEVATVPAGGTLTKIARGFGCGWRLIARANGIKDPRKIRVGDRLKIPNRPLKIHVRKRAFLLDLTYDGGYFRSYSIGTGKSDTTPEADFVIKDAQVEPTWYGPDGVYPFGDERNIIGTRWLGFDRGEYSGYGIHGTNKPDSIGKESSAGCIRMRNADVEELFELVTTGVSVTISK